MSITLDPVAIKYPRSRLEAGDYSQVLADIESLGYRETLRRGLPRGSNGDNCGKAASSFYARINAIRVTA